MRIAPLVTILAALGTQVAAAQQDTADVVFTNGKVYTASEKQARADAVAVRGNRIVYVGGNGGARKFIGPKTRVIDLQGATVLPGLTDSHMHLAGVGEREMSLNLEGTKSLDEFLALVKVRVDQARAGQWVTGGGWIETFWKPPVFPTRQDLDRISPANPVVLQRADGHALIANSAALRLAGITRDTKPPAGGAINKDASGEPTGMITDRAMGLIERVIPPNTDAELDQQILKGVQREVELGWTQIQDAGGSWSEVERIRRLYRDGRIKIRIYKDISGPGADATRLIDQGPVLGEFDGRLTVRNIKVIMDGALGSRGAALLAPYSDDPRSSGLITTDTVALKPMLAAAAIG